jgi:hypothetical protein
MSRWQSRVFVFLGAVLGLTLVGGLVVAASLTLEGSAQSHATDRPAVISGRG